MGKTKGMSSVKFRQTISLWIREEASNTVIRQLKFLESTVFIDAAMKYYDKTQFGRDRTPGDPQRFYNVNSLVWRCGAAVVRALPVLTAHDISLPEQ